MVKLLDGLLGLLVFGIFRILVLYGVNGLVGIWKDIYGGVFLFI